MIEIGAKKPDPQPVPYLPAKLEVTDHEIIITYEDTTHTVPITEGEFNLLELDDTLNKIISKIWEKEREKTALRRKLMGQ